MKILQRCHEFRPNRSPPKKQFSVKLQIFVFFFLNLRSYSSYCTLCIGITLLTVSGFKLRKIPGISDSLADMYNY